MKHQLLSLSLFCLLGSACAQNVLTVCNLPECPAQHASLASALEAASPGDIVQLLPSPLNYGDATVAIPITIQGGGHVADPLSGAYAKIGTISVTTSDFRVEGVYLRAVALSPSAGEVIENVEVINNRFYGSGNFVSTGNAGTNDGTKNWSVQGNVMTPDEAPNSTPIFTVSERDTSWSIDHNYIDQYWPFQRVLNGGGPVGEEHALLFHHNLVHTGTSGAFSNSGGLNASCHSNLFWVVDTAYSFMPSSATSTSFVNNLMYSPMGPLTNPDESYENVMNEAPEFVSVSGGGPVWNVDSDYSLAPGSPGIGDGLNGSDVGLFGDLFSFNNSGVPPGLPTFTSISKAYEIVPVNAPLEVEVEWNAGQ